MMQAYAKVGAALEAMKFLRKMLDSGMSCDVYTYNHAISAYAKGGEAKAALALLREIPKRGVTPNIIPYNAAVSACAEMGWLKKRLVCCARWTGPAYLPMSFPSALR